jgi:hypothetical protein
MEQNNFEKIVQHKLDELKIPPSDSVWTNIEKQIGKKGKDRKFIFILFFLILFLLTGGYWLLNSSKNNQQKKQQISNVIKKEKDSKATNKEDSSFQKSKIILHENAANKKSASVSSKKIKSSAIYPGNKTAKKKQKSSEGSIEEFNSKLKRDISKQINNEDSQVAFKNVSKLIKKNDDIFLIEHRNVSDILKDTIQNKIDIIRLSNQPKTKNLIGETIAINKITQKKDSANPNKNPWNFGITFSGGSSLITSNILERNYPSLDMNAGAPLGGNLNSGNPSYYYSASPIKNSIAFIAGVLVEKQLSARTKFAVGISYKYYSLTNKVGNKIDSIFASPQYMATNYFYNSANRSHSYRNNFHFLELPVSIKLQLNKSKRLPLFWNAGIDISELISSNALQFKSSPGVYYNDNSIFNKTQFGVHTGLSFVLFSEQKAAFTFGPYFYYGATSLSDKGLYTGNHFSFIGIQTQVVFGKK